MRRRAGPLVSPHDEHVRELERHLIKWRADGRMPVHDASTPLARWITNWLPYTDINGLPVGAMFAVARNRDDKFFTVVLVGEETKAIFEMSPGTPPPPVPLDRVPIIDNM